MISKIKPGETSFKGARVNILATADNHGNIFKMPIWLKTVENNAKDIFLHAGEESTRNFFAIVGDWFINPSKKGYLTNSKLTNGELQNYALLHTIELVRNALGKAAQGSAFFETLFTPGNHCLDGGDKFLFNAMKKNPVTTLVTNVDLERSPLVKRAMMESKNIVQSAEYSIPDDKKSDLYHKMLFVSATIPSMDFYNPGLMEGTEFYDNCNKKDANLKEEDIQGTINALKTRIDKFKKANPKGAVILLSHMGGRLSEIICKNIPQINQVLNGHDHKNIQTNVGKTSINSLGKDNEMIKALNFEFDDSGNLIKCSMTPYFTKTTLADGIETHPFQKFLVDFLEKDMQPIISLSEVKKDENINHLNVTSSMLEEYVRKMGITTPKEIKKMLKNDAFQQFVKSNVEKEMVSSNTVAQGLNELTYGNEVRYSNSYLMNYLTSALKRQIRNSLVPEIFSVAIQSSIVRNGLKDGANNLDVMKVFDGVSEDLSNLRIGNVKGKELVGLIVENVLSNLKAPTRNTIIHWSDVQVNRTLISNIQAGESSSDYSQAIKVRNQQTKDFEPIDLEKDYKIAIGEKYLVKTDIEWPVKIRDRFVSLDKTYDELFKEYLSSINYNVKVTSKTKEKRIL